MKNFVLFAFASIILISCGKSIDKNSFEGRVASVISDFDGVVLAVSGDLKSIIEKSGIQNGVLPAQYEATIKPYVEALTASINLEKPVFMMPMGSLSDNLGSGEFLVMFDVKDVERLKKEFKEMGFNLSKGKDVEFAVRGREAVGIYKGETGFVVMMERSEKLNENYINQLTKSMSAGKTVDGVVDYMAVKADMTMFFTGDKSQKLETSGMKELDEIAQKMSSLSKGTYWIAQMSFNDQEAVMTADFNYGKNLKKYMPMMGDALSEEAMAVIADENTFAVYAFNSQFEKAFSMIMDNLDEKTKAEMDKSLSMVGGMDKFKTMFTGEFAVAMASGTEDMNVSAFLGIGDKKQVQSLMDGFGMFVGLKKSGNGYEMDGNRLEFNDKGLMFTTNVEAMNQLKASKKSLSKQFGDFKFGSTPVSIFVDFQKMPKVKDFEDFAEAFKFFEFMTMSMDNNSAKMVFKSNKPNQNVLRTLIEAGLEMQRLEEIRQEKRAQEFEEMWGSWDDEDWDEEEWEF